MKRLFASLTLLLTLALPLMPTPALAHGPLRLLQQRPLWAPGEWVIKFKPHASFGARAMAHTRAGAILLRRTSELDLETVRVSSEAAVEAYRRDPSVQWIEPNARRYALLADPSDLYYDTLDTTTPDDPSLATWYKWDAHLIQCVDGWNIWPGKYYSYPGVPKSGPGVRIAIIDSGIDYSHPDFVNAGAAGSDSATGGQLDKSLDVSILNGVQTPLANDEFGHGTHVTGIAAAATNNAGVGVTGNGYNATVLSIKVIDSQGNGSESDIVAGIVYAANHGALVENLSLGGYSYSQAEQDAINYAWSKGTLIVAAAGNDGTDTMPVYPGALSRVLTVSATSDSDTLASYSDYGDQVGISAPGGDFDYTNGWFVDIYSTMPTYYVTLNDPNVYGATETYSYLEGTSMACPQVVGLAALYAGMKGYVQAPGVPLLLWQALQRGCDNVGGNGWDPDFGYGRINVYGTMNLKATPNPRGDTVGCVTGVVRYKGTPVANAALSAVPTAGASQSANSRADGGYRIVNAPAGLYNVTATVFGESQTINNVRVTAGCDIPAIDFNIAITAPVLVGATPLYATNVSTTIGIYGTGFLTGGVVSLNDTPLMTTYVSATQFNVVVPAALLTSAGTVSLTVSNPNDSQSNLLNVPIWPVLKSLTFAPASVAGGTAVTGTATLSQAAPPGGQRVNLVSSKPATVSVPPFATVPGGAVSVSFPVTTFPVKPPAAVIVRASSGTAVSATLSVH